MELEPEKRKLDRQAKAIARQEAAKKAKKRLLIGGIVAAVCLIAFIVLAIALPKRPADTLEATQPPEEVIRLAFAGDLNITEETIRSGGAGGDFSKVFMDVLPLLADADLTVLNLEGSIVSAPRGMLAALKTAGVDMVQMANSYAIIDGVLGLTESIDAVQSAGLTPLGVYKNEKAYQAGKGYTIRDVGGIRIAFVAFTKGMDGMTLPEANKNCVNILYQDYDSAYQKVNTARISAILEAAAQERPDLVVALLHWGSEYNDTISASQEKIRKLLFEKGVDAIIGTHSHYVQEMKLNDNGQFIAYCLGDFYSDASRSGSEYSVVLELEVTKSQDKTRITDFRYTPIFTTSEDGHPTAVVRLREAMAGYEAEYVSRVSKEDYDAMVYALTRIEARIHPEPK